MTALQFAFGGAGLACVMFALWYIVRQVKAAGAAQQRADDIALAAEAEAEMHGIQAEERDTVETRARMRDGSF